ncbi:hypothetical protein DFH08DRAFT_799133 [Mycena albidolilacea]|uniref:Uncharacterized protein n=1 Tax=Mycena albidolilacea TaxID=1033008 RepID=A0AAD7AQF6_9AGAR|nr:hypothetical protein DFH08DRAFT_799133 [Mycena albidolilacea]
MVRHKTIAGCELSTVDLVGHIRRPERALWRRKQARSDAAEARLSVRAIIDCDYSMVIFNNTRHHDEYMRTTTTTLKAGLLESGRAWSEVWSEDGGICIRAESTNQIPSRPSSRLQRRGQSGLSGWRETMWTFSEPVRTLGGLHQARKQANAREKTCNTTHESSLICVYRRGLRDDSTNCPTFAWPPRRRDRLSPSLPPCRRVPRHNPNLSTRIGSIILVKMACKKVDVNDGRPHEWAKMGCGVKMAKQDKKRRWEGAEPQSSAGTWGGNEINRRWVKHSCASAEPPSASKHTLNVCQDTYLTPFFEKVRRKRDSDNQNLAERLRETSSWRTNHLSSDRTSVAHYSSLGPHDLQFTAQFK